MEHHVRKDIREVLALLAISLDQYEQTTHGSIRIRNYELTIKDVAQGIESAYCQPSAYNISELSQCIDAFLKQENRGAKRPLLDTDGPDVRRKPRKD